MDGTMPPRGTVPLGPTAGSSGASSWQIPVGQGPWDPTTAINTITGEGQDSASAPAPAPAGEPAVPPPTAAPVTAPAPQPDPDWLQSAAPAAPTLEKPASPVVVVAATKQPVAEVSAPATSDAAPASSDSTAPNSPKPKAARKASSGSRRSSGGGTVGVKRPRRASAAKVDYAAQPPKRAPPVVTNGEYEVASLVAHRTIAEGQKKVEQYQVRWKGYSARHDTWEPASDLQKTVPKKVAEYDKRVKAGTSPKPSAGTKHPPIPPNSANKAKPKRQKVKQEEETRASDPESEDEDYEVQSIIGHKKIKGVDTYKVRWKGYDASHDTWEPEVSLQDSAKVLLAGYKTDAAAAAATTTGAKAAAKPAAAAKAAHAGTSRKLSGVDARKVKQARQMAEEARKLLDRLEKLLTQLEEG